MTESSVPVGETGKDLRTIEQTTSAGLVHTEAVSIVDPDDVNAKQKITDSAPGDSDYGAVVRTAGKVSINARQDIFGHLMMVSPYNQVEMRLDAADYADFSDETTASGGTVTQSGGVVIVASGTSATGSATLSSADTLEYRPSIGLYAGGTAVFSTGAAGCNQYAGIASDSSLTNCLMFGRKDGVFGILYRRAGSEVSFTAQADWDDPCSGAAGTQFLLDGVEETLNPTNYGGPYLVEAGLFGYAGWRASVWSPDKGWIVVFEYKNFSLNPVFTSNSFTIYIRSVKTSGSGDHTITGQCWAGGTGSQLERLGSTLNDRKLVQNSRSVITGKTTAGGGAYVDVKVSPSGALAMESEQSTHDNLNANTNLQVGDTDVSVSNPVPTDAIEGAITAVSETVTASGETAVITPSAGKAVRLWWYNINADPGNSAHVVAGLRFGTGAADFFKISLSQYGGAIAHGYKAGRAFVQGAADEPLIVNLSAAQTVYCNFDCEEVTP